MEIVFDVCNLLLFGILMKLFGVLSRLMVVIGWLFGFFVKWILLNIVLGVLLGFLFWFLLIGLNG